MLTCKEFISKLDDKCGTDYYRYSDENREKIFNAAKEVMLCFSFPIKDNDNKYNISLNESDLIKVIKQNQCVFSACKSLLTNSYLIIEDENIERNLGNQTEREQYMLLLQNFSCKLESVYNIFL